MKARILGFLASLSLGLLPFAAVSCGGGGGTSGSSSVLCGDGSIDGICISGCNLGCSVTGCSVNEIFQNQPIILTFTQNVDPQSVTSETVQIRTSQGREPVGSFFVQANSITFVPEVRVIQTPTGPQLEFGFAPNETYVLTIPNRERSLKTITTLKGGPMLETFTCSLYSNGQIKDFDERPPCAEMLIPKTNTGVSVNTSIVLEFTELINTSTLFDANGNIDGVTFGIAQFDSNGICSSKQIPLPGTYKVSVNQAAQRTVLSYFPSGALPGNVCIVMTVTEKVQDLSGKRSCRRVFTFKTGVTDVKKLAIVEDFSNPTLNADQLTNGAKWAAGAAKPVSLGGSGALGEFNILDGKNTGLLDAQGRTIYEWDGDNQSIPATRTLTGKTITVSNGVFEFSSMVLDEKQHLRFVGKSPITIRVAGKAVLNGAISVEGFAGVPDPLGSIAKKGQAGRPGGPGGATGGRGGDVFGVGAVIDGGPGEDIVVPAGHPLASVVAGTGGKGSKANPSGESGVKYSFFDVICQQTASGAGGGGFLSAGGKGSSKANGNATSSPPKAYDFGAEADGGKAVSLSSILGGTLTESSAFYFLIGGSGGGGAGTHPVGSISGSTPYRHTGAGGSGGGGTLQIKAGGAFRLPTSARISANGGAGLDTAYIKDYAPAAGGAGSAGSILIQSAGTLEVFGLVTAVGGAAGKTDNSGLTGSGFTAVDALSGAGGDGFIRIEADPKPDYKSFDKLLPAKSPDNAGLLRSTDYDTHSVLSTNWYDTKVLFPPKYLNYVIEASIDGKDVTFSDAAGGTQAKTGEPLVIFFQGGQLSGNTGQPIPSTISRWVEGRVDQLNLIGGNTFRFLIVIDGSVVVDPSKTVIKKVTVNYQA